MITIIGAGPAGCYSACLLSKKGQEVQIFEEHKEVGCPVQCTGIATASIKEILKLKKDVIVNEIDKVRISCKENSLELKLKNKNIILDRKKFDNYLADMAVKEGTRIFLNYRFIENKKDLIKIRYDNKRESIIKTDYLVGADGPLSQVAKSNSLFGKRTFLTGLQAVAEYKNDNSVEFYPSIGTFAWVVPQNQDICRIGIASYKNPKDEFEKFLKSKGITKIIEKQAGLIPIFNKRLKTQKDNIFLIGDAATQVKATTGGGIIQSMKAAQSLCDAIVKGTNYDSRWRKEMGRDLLLHLKMRKMMNRFKEKEWNHMIDLFKKEKTKKIIESFDRDYPTKFLLKLLINEPRLLFLARFLF
jgi:digeranylgeranylglycerophospholipid reductase